MEDLLTSDIFGCIRYLPPEKVLIPFFNLARSYGVNSLTVSDNVIDVHYAFWPWLEFQDRIPCEPDLVIGLETSDHNLHIVMIEVKYYSGLSSEEDERPEPNDQLAREMDNLDVLLPMHLGWRSDLNVVSRTLLFITQNMGIPRELLAKSLNEYRRKRKKQGDIFWLSWRFLPRIIENRLKQETSQEYRCVLSDMLRLLKRKDLEMFEGIEPILSVFTLPQFYVITQRHYAWPSFAGLQDIQYKYEEEKDG
jgi:hypothetical protein